jgi:hypothetical protein
LRLAQQHQLRLAQQHQLRLAQQHQLRQLEADHVHADIVGDVANVVLDKVVPVSV